MDIENEFARLSPGRIGAGCQNVSRKVSSKVLPFERNGGAKRTRTHLRSKITAP